jgi:hypothetical protein
MSTSPGRSNQQVAEARDAATAGETAARADKVALERTNNDLRTQLRACEQELHVVQTELQENGRRMAEVCG